MSGKKAQRTKGNVKPSSSSRAAEFLHQEGNAGFIGFSGLAGNSLGYVPKVKNEENELDGDLRMLLRKMTKKDAVTKLKAIQEFTVLCKEKDNEVILNILSFWPRIFHKLSHDFDHRVREATQQAHHQIVTKAGRNLAPYLKQMIVDWIMSRFDTYAPASSCAHISFDQVFKQQQKKKEVLLFCKIEIFENLQNNLLKETVDTLSDPKVVPIEERESKFHRFISSSLHTLSYFLQMTDTSHLQSEEVVTCLLHLLNEKRFWKFVKNKSPLVRNAFYTFLASSFQTIKGVMIGVLSQCCPAALTHLDEQEPTVVASMWDAALVCLSTFENAWEHVNSSNAVFPNLWKLLKNYGFGNINVVYPNLVLFLMRIPEQVTGEGTGFFIKFFTNFVEGLRLKQDVLTASDTKVIIASYIECVSFLLFKRSGNSELIAFLVNSQLKTMFSEIFLSENTRQMWYGEFFMEVREMLTSICDKRDEGKDEEYIAGLERNIWGVVRSTVTNNTDNECFKGTHRNFYDSLVDFIFCFCNTDNKANQEKKSSQFNLSIKERFHGHLYTFLEDCITCYVRILKSPSTSVKQDFARILHVSLCRDILEFTIRKTTEVHQHSPHSITSSPEDAITETTDEISIAKAFCELVLQPLLSADDSDNAIFLAAVAILKILDSISKGIYLKWLLQEFAKSSTMKLNILSEIFNHHEDKDISIWLQSVFVQDVLLEVCSSEGVLSNEHLSVMRWDILKEYTNILKDYSDSISSFTEKLLLFIDGELKDETRTRKDEETTRILACYSILGSKKVSNCMSLVIKVWVSILEKHVKAKSNIYESTLVSTLTCEFEMREIEQFAITLVTKIKALLQDTDYERLVEMTCQVVRILSKRTNKQAEEEMIASAVFMRELLKDDDTEKSTKMARFLSSVVSKLSADDTHILQQACLEKRLLFWCDRFLQHICECQGEHQLHSFKVFLKNSEWFLSNVIESTLNSAVLSKSATSVQTLLAILSNEDLLTETLIDVCLQAASPLTEQHSDLKLTTIFTTIVPFVDDISCIRALVEQYADELQNNAEMKKNPTALAHNLAILSSVLRRWYSLIVKNGINADDDYNVTVSELLDVLLVWKDEGNYDLLLFDVNIKESKPSAIALNSQLIDFLLVIISTDTVNTLRKEHWDFILCSLVSWLQSCQESFVYQVANSAFFINTLKLFYLIAAIFRNFNVSDFENDHSSAVILDLCISSIDVQTKQELYTEWNEFFLPAASGSVASLLNAVMKDTNKLNRDDEFSKVLCACLTFIPESVITEEWLTNDSTRKKKSGQPAEEFFLNMCHVMSSGSWCFRLASAQMLSKIVGVIEGFCTDHEEDEDHEEIRCFPECLILTMEESRNETLKSLALREATIIEPAQQLETKQEKKSLLTYLLSWQLMLQIFKASSLDKRAKLANYFHKTNHVNDLVTCLFCIMPITMEKVTNKKVGTVLHFEYKELQCAAVNLLRNAMQCIPALLRHWFKNHLNRKESVYIDRFVSTYVSPVLLNYEFRRLDQAFKTFDNMVVRTRPNAREVAAIYTIEEISMELIVKLASNYPLSPVTVDCGKRIGVTTQLWRQWMLQLTTFLSFQNGTILDGLSLWKRNVDKRFEGVEECMICFSVIHGSNYSLPTISCKTCKKKFHPACLYKWFNASGKSTCPLCRNIF